ncbi:hypothetical protein Mycsm_06963 (plasmid) [Mycobacterium sp. JS623]|nr:hypothetical protein Mycsm_06963 [Mycobacterium sp. JS623]
MDQLDRFFCSAEKVPRDTPGCTVPAGWSETMTFQAAGAESGSALRGESLAGPVVTGDSYPGEAHGVLGAS